MLTTTVTPSTALLPTGEQPRTIDQICQSISRLLPDGELKKAIKTLPAVVVQFKLAGAEKKHLDDICGIVSDLQTAQINSPQDRDDKHPLTSECLRLAVSTLASIQTEIHNEFERRGDWRNGKTAIGLIVVAVLAAALFATLVILCPPLGLVLAAAIAGGVFVLGVSGVGTKHIYDYISSSRAESKQLEALRDISNILIKELGNTSSSALVDPSATKPTAKEQVSFLNAFPLGLTLHPNWGKVVEMQEQYYGEQVFDNTFRSGTTKTLHAQCLSNSQDRTFQDSLGSMEIYTKLQKEAATRVAFERQMVNIAGAAFPCPAINEKVLGCKLSGAANQEEALLQAGNQVSIAMRIPMLAGDKKERRTPLVLSVAAPALDSRYQPGWYNFVDLKTGDLKMDGKKTLLHEVALRGIAQDIQACAANHSETTRVVLSAFGMNSFLGGLDGKNQDLARKQGVQVFADLIIALQKSGKKVVFSDIHEKIPFWLLVNNELVQKKQKPITCIGKIPGDWISDKDLIVNAWDPFSLIGNGCAQDASFDGYVGANSLAHNLHALACAMFQQGVVKLGHVGNMYKLAFPPTPNTPRFV